MTTRRYSSTSQETTLTSALSSSATTMVVGSATALLGGISPANTSPLETFVVVIDPDTALEEIVEVVYPSAPTSNTLTIVRQVDGTAAIAHSAGAKVRHMAIGRDFREANTHIESVRANNATAHGIPLNTIVLTSDTGTVSTAMLASNSVTTVKITDANVTTAKIADGAITSAKIADGAIATVDIADAAVTSAKILDGSVGTAKIDDAAVTAAKIGTSAVTTSKIADLNVTTAKLADLNVTTGKIADSAITSAKIADGTIVTADLADSAVTSAKIADGTIVTADLADSAVTSAKILDGTIVNADINATAAIDKTKIAGTAVTVADTGTVTSAMILDGTIVNADISGTAAIAPTKVAGTAVTQADSGTVTSTMIADSTIVNADISPTAAIAKTKLDLNGTITSADIADGTILNADINPSAAIALSKLAVDPLARANHTGTQTSSTISDFDTQVRTSKVTDLAAPTSSFSMNSQKIVNLADPTANQDAVTLKYLNDQKGANNGIASLDGSGKIPTGQLPAIAISDTFVVASQAAMLALTAEIGDIAVRTDLNKSFILRVAGASTLANWQELLTPTDSVLSVDGNTGAIDLTGTYLAKAGGTMTGNLILNANPTTNLGAATKQYVDTVAGSTAAAQAAAAAAEAAYDSFDDRYLGAKSTPPTLDNDGNALVTGAIYWNSVTNQMFAWTGSAWGSISSTADVFRFRFTVSGGQTSLSGLDDNGVTLAYLPGKEQVYLNGVLLVRTSDYTATTGTSITSLAALAAGDIVEVITFTAFELADSIARAIIDAKGDLLVGVSDNTAGKLPVGTNGQVLTADSAVTLGVKWATPAPGYSAPTLGSTSIASGATVTNVNGLTINSTTIPTSATLLTSGGALGTPSSGTLTNVTGLPVSTGISGLGTGVATFLATPTSANLAAAVTDETGSGALVFAAGPTLTGTVTATGDINLSAVNGPGSVIDEFALILMGAL